MHDLVSYNVGTRKRHIFPFISETWLSTFYTNNTFSERPFFSLRIMSSQSKQVVIDASSTVRPTVLLIFIYI